MIKFGLLKSICISAEYLLVGWVGEAIAHWISIFTAFTLIAINTVVHSVVHSSHALKQIDSDWFEVDIGKISVKEYCTTFAKLYNHKILNVLQFVTGAGIKYKLL